MISHRVYTQLDELISLRIPAKQLSLRFDARRLQQINGVHLSRFKGQGIDFAEHRQYQPGDDPRSIDWRVTARRGRTHTRIYHEEIERPVLIMIDQSITMYFGSKLAFKSVRSAELGAILSWAGLQHGDRIGGLVFSDSGHQVIKPSRHPSQALRLLECVNSFNRALKLPAKTKPIFGLNDALLELRRIARPGSQCFLISDWRQFNEDSSRLLFELNRHCQLLVLQVFDPLESHLPPGSFRLTNGERELQVDTGDKGLESRFSAAYQAWQQEVISRLAKTGIPCAPVATWDDPMARLRSLQFGAASEIANETAPADQLQAVENSSYGSIDDIYDTHNKEAASAFAKPQRDEKLGKLTF